MWTRVILLASALSFTTCRATRGDCDFDAGTTCEYSNSTEADFSWTVISGETPSRNTGPSSDRSGQPTGFYAYIETSYPRLNRDAARLVSPKMSAADGDCFTFFYHMHGLNIRTLNIYTRQPQSPEQLVWRLEGEQGDAWKEGSLPLRGLGADFQVVIEGMAGTDYMADIAIDDIAVLRKSNCPVYPPEAVPLPPQPTPVPQPPVIPVCGIKPLTRIVGGTEAPHNSWPWQALLAYQSSSGEWKQFCGGSLIMPDWVLTAAHCISDMREEDYSTHRVIMGAHYKNTTQLLGTEQTFDIKGVYVHPEYNSVTRYNYDIALMHLERPAILGQGVGLVCLPKSATQFPPGTSCSITGWGTLQSGGESPETLQQAQVPLVSSQECSKNGSYEPSKITQQMLCAGFPEGGVDACQGDSGGPLVCADDSDGIKRWYLAGDTSWGYGCAFPDYYGIYARVQAHTDWLYTVLNTHGSS